MLIRAIVLTGVVGVLAGASVFAQGDSVDQDINQDIHSAITSGDAHLAMRYRYEFVDQDGFAKDANASTLRLRLNYRTGHWRNWSAFGEFDYIAEILADDFNSGGGTSAPARNQFPVVADPHGPDLNQLYFDYNGFADTRVRIGRQRILLDDQRYVGGVGWRQNEQTFDGVSGIHKRANVEFFYSYITQVNRIFGEDSAVGSHDTNTHLLNAKIEVNKEWLLTPFYYYIDNDSNASFSTATIGIRANGKYAIGRNEVNLLGLFSTQSDAGNNPVNYDADYYHLTFDWVFENKLSLGLAYEMLEGDANNPGSAYRTPLATLHPFQGWADQFLTTPDAGIDDFYFKAKYPYRDWNLQATYHDFEAADGPGNWGSEIDVSASRKLNDRISLLLKAAFFNADDAGFNDVNKIWIQLVANY